VTNRSPYSRLPPIARPTYRGFGVLLALVGVEVSLVLAYVAATGAETLAPRYFVYPFVWINAAGLAALVARDAGGSVRPRVAAIAIGYFAVLAAAGGVISPHGHGSGLSVAWLPPGWGPMLVYDGAAISLSVVPFKLVGYLGLTYLFAHAIDRSLGAGPAGALGLLSCVSCAGSLASALTAAVAGTSLLAVESLRWSYDLSTAVFLASILGLLWAVHSGS